jgi:hypothetical protein
MPIAKKARKVGLIMTALTSSQITTSLLRVEPFICLSMDLELHRYLQVPQEFLLLPCVSEPHVRAPTYLFVNTSLHSSLQSKEANVSVACSTTC